MQSIKTKLLVFLIIGLFLGVSIVSGISGINRSTEKYTTDVVLVKIHNQNDVTYLESLDARILGTNEQDILIKIDSSLIPLLERNGFTIKSIQYQDAEYDHSSSFENHRASLECELVLEDKSLSDPFITEAQYKKLRSIQNTILLDVHDIDTTFSCCGGIEGSTVVTLYDLSCGSCIESRLYTYDSIVVYSTDNLLRTKAADLLRDDNYVVYEITDISDLKTNQVSQTMAPVNDQYATLQLSNNAHVGVYEREERIKRLFGAAFSQGDSPVESAESFIIDNAYLFGVNPKELQFSHIQPIMYNKETETYKFTGVYFTQFKHDVPVFNSRLILLVRNEDNYPLVLVSANLWDLTDYIFDLDSKELDPLQGIMTALDGARSLVNVAEPELVVWAGIDDLAAEPMVSYAFIADNDMPLDGRKPEKYLFVTDAETGEILYKEDMILVLDVTGNVQGNATQGKAADFCEDVSPEVLKWARVNIGGTVAYTDEHGDFILLNTGSSPVTVESRLWGQWFRVFNSAGADSVLSIEVTPPGPANFLHNALNDNEQVRAEVNAYYHSNIVREFALKYNPSYPGLTQNEFPVYVNQVGGYCPGNAWYDYSSINFCQSGSGYPNTAFSTVIHHEYGHHLVHMGGSGQGAYGEGMSDSIGMLITDDPGIGYGFFGSDTCNQPLRTGDNTMQYPCSGGIHYCGQLLSGCIWSTRNELINTKPDTYLDIISNLAVNSILLRTPGDTSIDPSITIDFLTLDDDNANIFDGTPHYQEIAAGFGAHNMHPPPLDPLSFSFPDGLPLSVLPADGSTVRVVVNPLSGNPEPGTGMFHYNMGDGWQHIPMTQVESHVYDATFPGSFCLNTISYYFSAEDTSGQLVYSPSDAPSSSYSTVFAHHAELIFADDFETDKGWTVENCDMLTDGAWERGVPVGGGKRGDPPTDYDGSGHCYLTGNRQGDSDVDDGYTWLISPTFDLTGWDNAKIDYAVWYTNNFGANPNNDYFRVHVSNDDGASWVLAHEIGPATPLPESWYTYEVMIGDFVTLNDQIKVRFEASDVGASSIVEAGVDAVSVVGYSCLAGDPPEVTVTRPDGGEVFMFTSDEEITWSATAGDDEVDYIQLLYSIDAGSSWKGIASGLPNSGSYLWSVPNEDSTQCLVRVRAVDVLGRVGDGVSDAVFTIEGVPPAPPEDLIVTHISAPVMSVFDDFSDGTYDDWTMYSGSWDASHGYLEGYGSISTPALLNGEAVEAYGRWEFDIQLNQATSGNNMRLHFIQLDDPDTRYSSGYYVFIRGDSMIRIWRWDNGNTPGSPVVDASWSPSTEIRTVAVERNEQGEFSLFVDDELVGTGTDKMYLTTEYMGFRHTQSHRVHEIRVETMGDDDDHNLLTWSASPDDPAEVAYYTIYRSEQSMGPWDTSTFISGVSANGSASYEYVDEFKGLVDDTFWWYVVRAVGKNGLEEDNDNAVQEPGQENQPPIASFYFEPSAPMIYETVFFNSTSFDPDGFIVNWTWDMDDGTMLYGEQVTHEFESSSNFYVELTVTDNGSAVSSVSQLVFVSNGEEFSDIEQELSDRGFRLMPGWDAAQEFVPSYPVLSRVELYMTTWNDPVHPIPVEIRKDDPIGDVLFSSVIYPDDVTETFPEWGWVSVDIGVPVEVGETYVIVLRDSADDDFNHLMWGVYTSFGIPGPYPDGNMLFRKLGFPTWMPIWDFDCTFKTYGYE